MNIREVFKIKTDCKDCPYITAGKEYEVKSLSNGIHVIIDDEGFKMAVKLNKDGNWLIGNTYEDSDS